MTGIRERLARVTAALPWNRAKPAAQPPDATPAMPPPPGPALEGAEAKPADLEAVVAREIQHIRFHRHRERDYEEVKHSLVGLALSGGGIRSATTNLGVLQALSAMDVLPMVDYMCTVSGGGYIGACLSTLLSLNKQRLPAKPSTPLAALGNPHEFAPGNTPAFDTTCDAFPFRVGQVEPHGLLANDVVAHLRTHGNFLIAHRGLLRRDTMRAIGNLVTGVAYNVFGFLLLLVAVSALYLATARKLMPGMEGIPAAAAPSDTAKPTSVPGDTTRVRTRTIPCGTPEAPCEERVSVPFDAPTWATLFRYRLSQGTAGLRDTWNGLWDPRLRPRSFFAPALMAFYAGLVLSVLALFWVLAATRGYRRFWRVFAPPPCVGESQEDSFDRRVLNVLAWWVTAGLIGVMLALRLTNDDLAPAAQFVWLFAPLIVLVGARVGSFVLAVFLPFLIRGNWTRRVRSLWGGYQAITVYGTWITVSFALLVPLMFAYVDMRGRLALGGVASIVATRLLATRTGGARSKLALPAGLVRFLLGLAVLGAIGCGLVFFGAELVALAWPAGKLFNVFLISAGTVVLLSILVDQNKLSPHYFYRDRLAETYLLSEIPDTERRLWVFRDAMEMPLHHLHGELAHGTPAEDAARWCNPAPYHLISCAINLAGSRDLTRKDRKSGYWLFSKLYSGSVHTGFRPTEIYRKGKTKVARAAAISGAAASSAMGFMTFFAQAFAMVLFNIRLGCWMENPLHTRSFGGERLTSWLWLLMKEVTMTTTETDRLVNLSDGGHTGDNVGIYPLMQRRCKIIIASDAEQDGALAFGSFTEALRHAYIDLGISVDIDLSMIRPDPLTGRSRSHCAVGRIQYPDRPDQQSYLIYMKNSLTGDEQEPVLNYQVSHPAFPHESTADQFFTDAQFGSYRSLGVHIAETTFEGWIGSSMFAWVRDYHWPSPCPS